MIVTKHYNDDCVKFSDSYEGQFDSVVTDPPYGIEYLGNDWDSYQNCIAFKSSTWESISRVLKPGGYMLIFGASKTFHRLTCAVEDSGLKIRDVLMWLYGQGMPKSQNIGKKDSNWEGWGTGLKPCYEPILLAQKPISEKTIVKNFQKHGVGGINIEDTRLESGRWAGNVLHDGSDEVEEQFAKYGERGNGWNRNYGVEAVEKTPYKIEKDLFIALDVAASELYNGKYNLISEKKQLSTSKMVDYLKSLVDQYPIVSIEDGLDENDWEGWSFLRKEIGNKCQIVGDDLTVTNVSRLKKAIDNKAMNAILIKLNQIGTISETIEAISLAKKNNYGVIISHRSGETEDVTIADFAVAMSMGQIKTGSVSRTDRVAKYNQLLRIEENLKNDAKYPGFEVLGSNRA